MLRPFGAEKGCMSPSLCLLVFDSVVALEKREIDRVPKFFSPNGLVSVCRIVGLGLTVYRCLSWSDQFFKRALRT